MKNLYNKIGIIALTAVILFSMSGCPDDTHGDFTGDVWEAANGTELIIYGNLFTRVVPAAEGFITGAISNVKGRLTKTDTEITVTVIQYSTDGGIKWVNKNQFLDNWIKTNYEQVWNAADKKTKETLRNTYRSYSGVNNLPETITLTYEEFKDLNQLYITKTITTSASNPTGTNSTTGTGAGTNTNPVLYQKTGTRTVPANLEGTWTFEDVTNIGVLEFTLNSIIIKDASNKTYYVKNTNGKLELSETPGGEFNLIFCDSYEINNNGVLSFTGGQSNTWYSGKSFVEYIFPGKDVPVATLTADQWNDGNIIISGGEQWFKFTATAATQYIHFNTTGTLNDVYVEVYDVFGVQIGSRTNLWSVILRTSRTLSIGQTYYIKVYPYNSNGSGTFYIGFNDSTTAPATFAP